MSHKTMPQEAAIAKRSLKHRHRRTAVILAIVLVTLGILVIFADSLGKRPDLFLVRHVRSGMTESEVIAVFGESPTTITPWQIERLYGPSGGQGTARFWYCDAGFVRVFFGNDGRVVSVNQHRHDREVENPLARKIRELLRRIHLL
jgi:hypothetical protein